MKTKSVEIRSEVTENAPMSDAQKFSSMIEITSDQHLRIMSRMVGVGVVANAYRALLDVFVLYIEKGEQLTLIDALEIEAKYSANNWGQSDEE